MQSPQHMKIIQIEITNACPNMCSNCTRFCGHHKKPFFMDFETFKKAVASMRGYKGMVGVMGGEPTLHPEFEKFSRYICAQRGPTSSRHLRQPVRDLQAYIMDKMASLVGEVGLWSSLATSYYKHFEVINDCYQTQILNDHNNTIKHQALLMPRKELGVPDDEWIRRRDDCFVQKYWSASITPKGAFFCEIAASLDMLFDGPGGWEIEPGWWLREPSEFGDQLQWCELCSAALPTPHRLASDGRDDMTPGMFKKLLELGSPKLKKGLFVVHDPSEYSNAEVLPDKEFKSADDYIARAGFKRFDQENRNLFPKSFCICSPEDLHDKLKKDSPDDWVLVGKDNDLLEEANKYFNAHVINPGCFYIYKNNIYAFNVRAHAIREMIKNSQEIPQNIWSLYPINKIIAIENLNIEYKHDILSHIAVLQSNFEEMNKKNKELKCDYEYECDKETVLNIYIKQLMQRIKNINNMISNNNNSIRELSQYSSMCEQIEKIFPKNSLRRKLAKRASNSLSIKNDKKDYVDRNYNYIEGMISIIVPVYNAESTIRRTLESLKNQTYKNIEILCIDNGSKDGSASILREFEQLDWRFKILTIEENKGPGQARNLGLQNMHGEYLMFCDSDDWYNLDMCEIMYQSIHDNKVDMVVCRTIIHECYTHKQPNDAEYPNYINNAFPQGYTILTDDNKCEVNVLLWNKIFSSKIVKRNKIFFNEKSLQDDVGFIYFYLLYAKLLLGIPTQLYNTTITDNSTRNCEIFKNMSKNYWWAQNYLFLKKNVPNIFIFNNYLLKQLNLDLRNFWRYYNEYNSRITLLRIVHDFIKDFPINNFKGKKLLLAIKFGNYALAQAVLDNKAWLKRMRKITGI